MAGLCPGVISQNSSPSSIGMVKTRQYRAHACIHSAPVPAAPGAILPPSNPTPPAVLADLKKKLAALPNETPFTMRTMALIKTSIEGWYQSRGYGLCYISHFSGMGTGSITAHVIEGRANKINVVSGWEEGMSAFTLQGSMRVHCVVWLREERHD